MSGLYMNQSVILDSNKINETISFFKKIFNKIKDSFKSIKSDETDYSNELSHYFTEVEKIKSSMNDIADLLEDNPLFNPDEFLDFLTIMEISEYILEDWNLFSTHQSYLFGMFRNFRDLVLFKLDYYLKNNDNDSNSKNRDYNEVYEKFEDFLDEQERYFYLEVYPYDGEYDDLITEVNNILEGD